MQDVIKWRRKFSVTSMVSSMLFSVHSEAKEIQMNQYYLKVKSNWIDPKKEFWNYETTFCLSSEFFKLIPVTYFNSSNFNIDSKISPSVINSLEDY